MGEFDKHYQNKTRMLASPPPTPLSSDKIKTGPPGT